MRLFLGIELPPGIKAAAAAAAAELRAVVDRAVPKAPIRWVDPANLHITVWFLGEVDEMRAASLNDALRETFQTAAFRLTLEGLGAYPPGGRPRVLWMGVASGSSSLVALHRELTARLPAVGFEAERRPYSPHLTLARVKEIRAGEAAVLRAAMERVRVEAGPESIEALTLFRSRTSPHGAQYETLLRVPLR